MPLSFSRFILDPFFGTVVTLALFMKDGIIWFLLKVLKSINKDDFKSLPMEFDLKSSFANLSGSRDLLFFLIF